MKKTRRAGTLLANSLANYLQMPPLEAKIRALRTESNHAIAAGAIEGVAASLDEDFVVVVGDGTFLTRAKYVEAFESTFNSPEPLRYERIADTIDLSASTLLAAERGHWIGSLPNGQVLFTGTYMAMWRRTGHEWKLRSELFVSLI